MFSESSYSESPFSAYRIIVTGNGEIFFFDGKLQTVINFDLKIVY